MAQPILHLRPFFRLILPLVPLATYEPRRSTLYPSARWYWGYAAERVYGANYRPPPVSPLSCVRERGSAGAFSV